MLIGGLSVAVAACSAPAQAPAPRDKDGATTIPREPTRVVTVGLSDHDYVLALGVVPVGLTDWYGDSTAASGRGLAPHWAPPRPR